ncbi:hypothetical protein VSDG_07699 [Cytospora chrysosperma]|uniref:CFEM domain-containing protein n=1 Tax=Cytospora chrysosperma TaxID=252740 RepID=A0A423VJ29_CYTCH|nr:hypothetical protein VSDG_07699 [Valsa sordida]
MKLLLALSPTLAFLYIGSVAAEECANVALTAIPSCAQNCILNGAPAIGCAGTDFDCQCAQSAALFAAVEGCVATACPSASYQGVIDGASTVCDCVSPALRVGAVAGTASASFYGGSVSAPAANSATVTSTKAASTGSVTSAGATVTTASPGSGNTWTGYTSVSNVATASVIGAAAQATPAINVIRYVIPVAMAGAAWL